MTETPQTSEVYSLPISEIVASKTNRRIDKDQLKELAESIKTHGVLSPVMVRPVDGLRDGKHEIVFGERRLKAAKSARLEEIPVIIREMTDVEALEAQIIENCQRQDIHPLEEADSYRKLHEEHGHPAEEIAAKVGKSKAYVYGRMKLCSLAAPARKAFFAGDLSASTALLIARIPNGELQKEATKEILDPRYNNDEPLSYRQAAEHIQKNFMLRLHDAPFSKTDAELVSKAGACNVCPKRTGNQPELFSDVKNADVCTDPKCYGTKLDAHWELIKADAGEKGYRVLSDTESQKTFGGRIYVVHDSGLVDLDDRAHDVGFYDKTYRQVLKTHKGEVQTVYARDGDGKIRKLADRKELQRVLKASGAKKSSARSSSSSTESDRRAERQRKARKTAAKSAVALMVEATQKRKPDAPFWRLLSLLAYNSAHGAPGNAVLGRHGIKPSEAYGDAKAKKVLEAVKKYSEAQARALTLDFLLADVLDYHQGHGYPLELAEVAKYFKVDLKKLEAAATEKLRPKTPAKKTSSSRKK